MDWKNNIDICIDKYLTIALYTQIMPHEQTQLSVFSYRPMPFRYYTAFPKFRQRA